MHIGWQMPPLPPAAPTPSPRCQWLTLGVFASVNLCLGVTLSCIVPFFPAQAKAKGLSTAEIGFIIGFYQLGVAVASPLLGRSMAKFGPSQLFSSGLCLAALAVASFGWLPHVAGTSATFFWSALGLRAMLALGLSAYKCSQMTLLAQLFPRSLATIGGLLDTFAALSYSVGPVLGSALTQLGGYSAPFTAFGLLMLAAGVASFWLLHSTREVTKVVVPMPSRPEVPKACEAGSEGTMRAVLALPEVWLTALGLGSLMLCCFFYDASLTEHLSTAVAPASPMLAGTLISVSAVTNMLSGPVCGILVDRNTRAFAEPIMLAGSVGGAIFALIIGPSPLITGFFRLDLPMLFVAFAIQGVVLVAMSTPSLRNCLRAAKERGLNPNCPGICGCISGLIQGSVSLGAFLGNSLGAWSTQQIGFEWTGTLAAALQIPFILALVSFKGRAFLCYGKQKAGEMPSPESRRELASEEEGKTVVEDCHPVSAI